MRLHLLIVIATLVAAICDAVPATEEASEQNPTRALAIDDMDSNDQETVKAVRGHLKRSAAAQTDSETRGVHLSAVSTQTHNLNPIPALRLGSFIAEDLLLARNMNGFLREAVDRVPKRLTKEFAEDQDFVEKGTRVQSK
ncbi:unnamed protein product [Hyaloperonospora brassicae]|uniref:RxLR effector protein n=1 Tax=Hyaloperonospora brassicae TaxID=162125 RepID=A0AAV0URV6_HYABA|nr:unnamed protein product [Hyaloperonospora brassicae]